MTLVDELRSLAGCYNLGCDALLIKQAADRIEELENVLNVPLTTDELLAEIKRRIEG
jgi:hypothetical protein